MKKIYFSFIIPVFLLSACSKDFLKPYDDRIVGKWRISDVDRVGIGGSTDQLSFREGEFVFNEDGSLVYVNVSGDTLNGHWDIQKRTIHEETIRTLQLTAIDFNSQVMKAEFYDDMQFRSTDHFVGKVQQTLRTYVTHFRR